MHPEMSNNSGSILLESVIALLILCLTIASVMLLAGIVIKGQTETEMAYEEAFELNSLRDQIADKIRQLPNNQPADILSAVGSIVASEKGWRFQLLSDESGLIDLLLIHETIEDEHEYRIKIYTDP